MIYHDKQLNKDIEIDDFLTTYNSIDETITVEVIKDNRIFDTFYVSTCLEISEYIS